MLQEGEDEAGVIARCTRPAARILSGITSCWRFRTIQVNATVIARGPMKLLKNLRIWSCIFLLVWGQAILAQQVSFRITPVRPVEELRAEALRATPPQES